jgi:hypothetical protein
VTVAPRRRLFRRRRPVTHVLVVLTASLTTLALAGVGGAAATSRAPAPPAPPITDAAGVPVGIAPPVIRTAPARHHSILTIGDSTLGQGVLALPGVLAQHGIDAEIHDAHVNGWGLLDPADGASALDVLGRELAAHPDVDTVIFEWAGVCAVACGAGKLAYGSKQFYDAWDAAARALVTTARGRGVQVVWAVSPPPAPAPTDDPPVEDWFSLPMRHQVGTTLIAHERAYGRRFGVAITDWSRALSDTSGGWQLQLSYDGAVHAVRLDDKVHLTEDGSARTSAWTLATLTQLWRGRGSQVANGKRSV